MTLLPIVNTDRTAVPNGYEITMWLDTDDPEVADAYMDRIFDAICPCKNGRGRRFIRRVFGREEYVPCPIDWVGTMRPADPLDET